MVVIVMLLVTENMLCIRKCTRSKSFTQFMLLSIVIAVMADRSFIVSVNVPAAFQNAKLSSPVACATPLRFAAQQCSIPRHIWRASGGGCRLLQKRTKKRQRRDARSVQQAARPRRVRLSSHKCHECLFPAERWQQLQKARLHATHRCVPENSRVRLARHSRSVQHHNLLHNAVLIITQELADLSTCLLTNGTAGQVSANSQFPFACVDIVPKTPIVVEERERLLPHTCRHHRLHASTNSASSRCARQTVDQVDYKERVPVLCRSCLQFESSRCSTRSCTFANPANSSAHVLQIALHALMLCYKGIDSFCAHDFGGGGHTV